MERMNRPPHHTLIAESSFYYSFYLMIKYKIQASTPERAVRFGSTGEILMTDSEIASEHLLTFHVVFVF